MKIATACVATLALLGSLAFIVSPPHRSADSPMIQSATADAAVAARVNRAYGELPLSFEANRGQTDDSVDFLARASDYTLFLTSREAVLALRHAAPANRDRLSPSERSSAAVVRMQLAGANSHAPVSGQSELPGKANYFIGSDSARWQANVPTYARVLYQDVYPGVDLAYYGDHGRLEYDFVVAPGADPGAIALRFAGSDGLEVDAHGDLVLRVSGGEIRQRKPLIYQEAGGIRLNVPGGYLLEQDGRIRFQLAPYDTTRSLVIDPVLAYATYLGGAGNDEGWAVAVDALGSAYVTGRTESTTFPTAAGAFDATFNGISDVFVTKLNPAGSSILYSTYLGSSGYDLGVWISVDADGAAYVAGLTAGPDFPTTALAFDETFSGGTFDAFVTKLNGAGSGLVYSTYLGGTNEDVGYGIAVDASGNAFLTGYTNSTDFPMTPGAFDTTINSGYDGFATKLDPSGSSLVYSTYLGGSGEDDALSIAIDASGNAYLTGFILSADFPTTVGAFDTTFNGDYDTFVTKLSPDGSSLVYSTYLGGAGRDPGHDIAVDAAGNAYVSGYTASSDFPTTPGSFDTTINGGFDAFVTKLSADGSGLVYSTYLGGSNFDVAFGIAVDSVGNASVTGYTFSFNFPTTPGGRAFQGVSDVLVTKLNAAGTAPIYSTYLGGSFADFGQGIAVDSAGDTYVTGWARSTDFPTTPNAYQTSWTGLYDVFVAKITEGGTPTPTTLTLVPTSDSNTVGTQHCVTATIRDETGNPMSSVTVRFSTTGSVNTGGSALTNSSGQAVFCYTGPVFPADDTIAAYADTNGDNARETGEPTGTATKTWVLPASTPGCQIAFVKGKITTDLGHKGTLGSAKVSSSGGGQIDYEDHPSSSGMQVQDMKVKSTAVLSVSCASDQKSATIYGTASINQSGSYDFRIDVTDSANSGAPDTYRIRLSTGYDSGAHNLESGNIKIS